MINLPITKWNFVKAMLFLFSPVVALANGHSYLGVTAGDTWGYLSTNNPNIVYSNGQITDSYTLSNRNSPTGLAGANAGYEFTVFDEKMAIALGVGAYYTPGHYTYRGRVSETIVGNLYNYKFTLASSRVMAEAQFMWLNENVSPFINFGLGKAWSNFSHYAETSAATNGFVALPPFQSHTTKSFAYQVGLGVAYSFNFLPQRSLVKHERLSMGYRLVSLPDVSSNIRGDVYPYKVSFGTLTSNEVYISYTHLF